MKLEQISTEQLKSVIIEMNEDYSVPQMAITLAFVELGKRISTEEFVSFSDSL